ncbi:MAG: glycoside hydrolase family 44 protein [Ruminococcus sp.]|jgi:hypothetical protein|nr:glycoside hydrolase family 44 protein [Ruminococcus sp.]
MKKRRVLFTAALLFTLFSQNIYAAEGDNIININPNEHIKSISPYIYGVNVGTDLNLVSPGSLRLGGNRLTAYNWENNLSNAGSDYDNNTDKYLVSQVPDDLKFKPGAPTLAISYEAETRGIPYTLTTLQVQGYVASNTPGRVNPEFAAPSKYWFEVKSRKGSDFEGSGNKDDEYVYMDEFMNYLFDKIGDSSSPTGIKGYSLDNEPALWESTHSLIQSEQIGCEEFIAKTVDMASMVKEMDSGAEVFGPALFGYSAFDNFTNAPGWNDIKASHPEYNWFVDYYLDEMKKAEENIGTRIVDVLDVHYYTEQKGVCGERSCNHYDNDGCIQARLDGVRSLYEEGYLENSWITDTGSKFFPLIPKLQTAIDTFYPGTKLGFTEYNFGAGDHISGAVTEALVLGTFIDYGVYFADIWPIGDMAYQLSAINMFTNYDGNRNGFGNTLVKSDYDNENIAVYSSVDSENPDSVKVIVINKNLHEAETVNINISSDIKYDSSDIYALYGDSPEIRQLKGVTEIADNTFKYSVEPLSITEFVINKAPEVIVTEAETVAVIAEAEAEPTERPFRNIAIALAGIAGLAAVVAVVAYIVNKKKR